jgi:uncharacterized hydrophobic protein (TIGR00271 family)
MCGVLHLRAIVPSDRVAAACDRLRDNPGVTNLVVLSGVAKRPVGDLVMCDVARESANDVIADLQRIGIERDGSIALDRVDLSLSDVAEHAELRAPGYGEDAVVWEEIDQRTAEETRLTWAFVMFLALATQLAAIAAIIDSPILIVGAMVLGPEFGAVAAISYGAIIGDLRRIALAVRTLLIGFAIAITITYVCALVGKWTGVIELDELPARELTGFVYRPDRWSFIVALLAGAAGVLSLTAGKSSALVGVFISVTTVPAAGNLAVAVALLHWNEVGGSLLQLGVNLSGMIIAGMVTLLAQKAGWALVRKEGPRFTRGSSGG